MNDTNSTYTLSSKVSDRAYVQDYSPKTKIDGVELISLKNSVGDEGDFSEVMRLTAEGGVEAKPDFKVRQINRSRIFAGSIKAWHFHYNQAELWYVSPHDQLFVGLWDVRSGSPTEGSQMRVSLGGGASQLLYIPAGVAHGMTNFADRPVTLYYFMNNQFNLNQPDEQRLPWDTAGADFWRPERD